jgi:alpha-L-rhamnosidase
MIKKLIFTAFLLIVSLVHASSQTISKKLQNSFIWSGKNDSKGSFTVFRKSFEISNIKSATLNIFADVRYILWINGSEVLRGPCRFDPKGPQYDFKEISKHLKKGNNTIAVLVMAHGSNGKMMDHAPGLTLLLEVNNGSKTQTIQTDETWRWSNHTRYLPAKQSWGFISDRIDARLDDGDWTSPNYNDIKWEKANKIDGSQWGILIPRQIPLLGKWNVSARLLNKKKFPIEISVDNPAIIELERMAQAYTTFDFEASAGDSIIVEFGYTADSTNITGKNKATNLYIAKDGRQQYTTTESYGYRYIKFSSKSKVVKLNSVMATDLRYPYAESGRFESNDAFLNELWKRASLTMLMNAEDGYMDCALREKAEWMGDAAVVEYPVSRVLFGYADDKKIIRSDAGLMKNMIRHISQSQTDSGTFKAHHPSDRWDIHGYIEDYSCLWVQSLRQVYENTGDKQFVIEMWKPLKKQMQWFMNNQSSTGLLLAREFVIFDNPVAYVRCQGATLNAFYYKALVDAAYLANIASDHEANKMYSVKAEELYKSFNKYLWVTEKQTYSSGISKGKQMLPTAHAALLALYMGIVPEDRKNNVESFLLKNFGNTGKTPPIKNKNTLLDSAFNIHASAKGINMPYTSYWLLDVLYNAGYDSLALNFIRSKWSEMLKVPLTGTLSEGFNNGDLCHNFGAVPAYFLSTKVLGVSALLPLKNKQIEIKPQLSNLTHAEGAVVTELGVIDVSWDKSESNLKFKITIPKGITAKVILPKHSNTSIVTINNKKVQAKAISNYWAFELSDGFYNGELIE